MAKQFMVIVDRGGKRKQSTPHKDLFDSAEAAVAAVRPNIRIDDQIRVVEASNIVTLSAKDMFASNSDDAPADSE